MLADFFSILLKGVIHAEEEKAALVRVLAAGSDDLVPVGGSRRTSSLEPGS